MTMSLVINKFDNSDKRHVHFLSDPLKMRTGGVPPQGGDLLEALEVSTPRTSDL